MDYEALRAEIAKPAYSGLTDAAIAAALNAPINTEDPLAGATLGRVWSRPRQAQGWTSALGRAHVVAADAAATTAQRGRAWTAIEIVERDGLGEMDPRVGPQRTALVAFLDQLVTDGILTTGDKAATLAALIRATSIADQIGCPAVQAAHIAAARSGA